MTTADLVGTLVAFKDLSLEDLEQLATHTRTQHFASGDIIVKDGDSATACFLVITGSAVVTRRSSEPLATSMLVIYSAKSPLLMARPARPPSRRWSQPSVS